MPSLSSSLLAQTIDDHISWMSAWSRVVCCEPENRATAADALAIPESFSLWRQETVKTLQDRPALEKLVSLYDQLHRMAHMVLLKMPETEGITPADYDTVAIKYQEFIFGLRRLERALAAADSGLDTLTGLRSRVGLRDDLMRELHRFNRNGKPFCVAMMDIDHFKKVNDTYGHEAGDKVLSAVANHVGRSLRPFDDTWRWGGEELLLCLKETDLTGGTIALERVRGGLEKLPIKIDDTQIITVTASFGIVCVTKGATIDEMIARADKALYQAKSGGRNRVEAGIISGNS